MSDGAVVLLGVCGVVLWVLVVGFLRHGRDE
jgi:hypothetical protein